MTSYESKTSRRKLRNDLRKFWTTHKQPDDGEMFAQAVNLIERAIACAPVDSDLHLMASVAQYIEDEVRDLRDKGDLTPALKSGMPIAERKLSFVTDLTDLTNEILRAPYGSLGRMLADSTINEAHRIADGFYREVDHRDILGGMGFVIVALIETLRHYQLQAVKNAAEIERLEDGVTAMRTDPSRPKDCAEDAIAYDLVTVKLARLAAEVYSDDAALPVSPKWRANVRQTAVELYWLCGGRGIVYSAAIVLMTLTRPVTRSEAPKVPTWPQIARAAVSRLLMPLGGQK